MRPRLVLILCLLAPGLAACFDRAHDPHFLPWQGSVYPGDSDAVMQYSTNPYRAPDAPPYWPGALGGGGMN
jgi:hypothetical protein